MEVSSSPFLLATPFTPEVKIYQHQQSGAYKIEAEGPHIKLSTFVGEHKKNIEDLFGKLSIDFNHEFQDMKEIFGEASNRTYYGDRKAQSDEQVLKRINFNAKRALDGNPFTGFAAIEKTMHKIIGFVSIGRGYEAGESQSGLILNSSYQNKGYGYEVVALAASIALVYAQNQFQVGSTSDKAPVFRFTATVLEDNEQGQLFLEKLGMKYLRSLTEKESNEPRRLYGVSNEELDNLLEQKMGIQEIRYEHITL